jgi:peptidoglycan hydrolase CwlO-like protein
MPDQRIQKAALTITRGIGSPTSIIIHTILFISSFLSAYMAFVEWNTMLLVLTTIVSLEAIYLSIFIQMTINYTTQELSEVSEDIEEMQEDIGEIQEDVDEIQEDVDELQEDVEDIGEDMEEMSEEEIAEGARVKEQKMALAAIQGDLRRLLEDVERLKKS